MSKKLKIKFVKFEKALAMQILKQKGNFQDSDHVSTGFPELCHDVIYICDEEERGNLGIVTRYFNTNAERDEYLKNIVRWISEEQFTTDNGGELKIGEMCEVRDDDGKIDAWEPRKLLAILPNRFESRYIVETAGSYAQWTHFQRARPIRKRNPIIYGDIYTWEM